MLKGKVIVQLDSILESISKAWSQYLRHGEAFEVHSDHKALIYMLTTTISTANRVVMRYILDLQGFDFSLHYIAGKLKLKML